MDELIQNLVSNLGVNEGQARGGAGLLFKIAKEKLGDGDFGSIVNAIGSVDDLISAAPAEKSGGLLGGLGGLASAVGGDKLAGLAKIAEGFKALGLDANMVGKFADTIGAFVQLKGGDGVLAILKKVLD